jgi:hypothetical protein
MSQNPIEGATRAKIHLDTDLLHALVAALDNYTDGKGMEPDDEDRGSLEQLLAWLEQQ